MNTPTGQFPWLREDPFPLSVQRRIVEEHEAQERRADRKDDQGFITFLWFSAVTTLAAVGLVLYTLYELAKQLVEFLLTKIW